MVEECDNLGLTNEYNFFHRFSMLDIKSALSKMKNAKALGPDVIPIEVLSRPDANPQHLAN